MKRSGYTEIISVDQGLAEDNLSAEPSALCPFIIPFILGYTACSYYVFRGKSADAGYH